MKTWMKAIAVLALSVSGVAAAQPFEMKKWREGEDKPNNRLWCGPAGNAGDCYMCKDEKGKENWQAGDQSCVVHYITDAKELAELKVTYDPAKQLFIGADGKPYDTGGNTGIYVVPAGEWKTFYVKSPYPEAVGNKPAEFFGKFHHSSFLAGKPVAMAGVISFKDGRLTFISNNSGHYKPSSAALQKLLGKLKIDKKKYPYKAEDHNANEVQEVEYVPRTAGKAP